MHYSNYIEINVNVYFFKFAIQFSFFFVLMFTKLTVVPLIILL